MRSLLHKVTPAIEYYDGLSLRERLLVLAAVAVLMHIVWDNYLLMPVQQEQKLTSADIETERQNMMRVDTEIAALLHRYQHDPNANLYREAERLQGQISHVDGRIKMASEALIGPTQMARVLEQVLDQNRAMRMIRLDTLPSVQLNDSNEKKQDENNEDAQGLLNVYQHGFIIVLEGDYIAMLDHLRALEALPWQFFWEGIEYQVKKHPLATVRIHLFTLSLSASWIGV